MCYVDGGIGLGDVCEENESNAEEKQHRQRPSVAVPEWREERKSTEVAAGSSHAIHQVLMNVSKSSK